MSNIKHQHYTEQELRDAVSNSISIRQALITLGIKGEGGNYRVINNAIKKYNIDTSHFVGQSWNKGKSVGPKRPITDYLCNIFPTKSHSLKIRLIKEGYKDNICESCGLFEWLGKPIPLELHHVNGNSEDNTLDNLLVLCPNCHGLTENFRGRNVKK